MKNEMEGFFKEQAFLDTCQLCEQRFGETCCTLSSLEKKETSVSKFWFDKYESMDADKHIYS
jgi:hypothetical protein